MNNLKDIMLWGGFWCANSVFAITIFVGLGIATHHIIYVPKAKAEALKHVLAEGS